MLLASHQPNFLPNLGYFYKMSKADLFVIFTNVQFSKGEGWQRRHKVKDGNRDVWLTVPVKGHSIQMIKNVHIDNMHDWRRKHVGLLNHLYLHSGLERETLIKLLSVYDREWERLADLNLAIIKLLRDAIGITTPIAFDEELSGEKEHLFINFCTKYKADAYLSGMGGKLYLSDAHFAAFRDNGIRLEFVDKDLTSMYPYSTIHYLFTEGMKKLREMLDITTHSTPARRPSLLAP